MKGLVLKQYGGVPAVRGASFTVEDSEIFALLGPNGAGKTTILESLEGFRQRDEGYVSVLDLDPGARSSARKLREQIGLVLQDIAVEPYLKVRETVARNAGYYPSARDVDEVISLVGLPEQAQKKVKDLSGGQKRRLDLALGVIGNPKLLFLDEPTTGFDPSARQGAWQVVNDPRRRHHHLADDPLHGRGPRRRAGRSRRRDFRGGHRGGRHPGHHRRPGYRTRPHPLHPARGLSAG